MPTLMVSSAATTGAMAPIVSAAPSANPAAMRCSVVNQASDSLLFAPEGVEQGVCQWTEPPNKSLDLLSLSCHIGAGPGFAGEGLRAVLPVLWAAALVDD